MRIIILLLQKAKFLIQNLNPLAAQHLIQPNPKDFLIKMVNLNYIGN
jgi:hypothetical protein